MATRQRIETKKKRKKWVSILAPKEFNNIEIGETYVEEPKNAIGKTFTTNLSSITRDIKKQNINISFSITDADNTSALSKTTGYKMSNPFIKRMTKRSKAIINDSFICITKDEKKIRIKPLILLRTKTYTSVLSSIRKYNQEYIKDFCKKTEFTKLIQSVISNEMQKKARSSLKKIYPINYYIIKAVQLSK